MYSLLFQNVIMLNWFKEFYLDNLVSKQDGSIMINKLSGDNVHASIGV